MFDFEWWVYVVAGIVGVVVGWWIGSIKGYPVLGAVLGIFTIVGWIIMALIPARGSRPLPASTSIQHRETNRPADLPPDRMPQHPPDIARVRDDHDGG
ncbi:MAG: hypothetical protein ACRDZ2_02050 [Ilumatobacteraceae bacterium]